jgi:hypothetical protein
MHQFPFRLKIKPGTCDLDYWYYYCIFNAIHPSLDSEGNINAKEVADVDQHRISGGAVK